VSVSGAIAITGALCLVLAAAVGTYAGEPNRYHDEKRVLARIAWVAFVVGLMLVGVSVWVEALS
jgi:Na+-driven multidrug efflux pump